MTINTKSSNVLLTGADGLLGRFALKSLLDAGYNVTAVDQATQTDNSQCLQVDARDLTKLANIAQGHDAIVHLAAIPNPYHDPPHTIFTTNVSLSSAVIETARICDIKRLVLASSQTVLGLGFAERLQSPDFVPVDETHPCRPSDIYSLSKLVSEELFEMAARRDQANVVALRYPLIWNPNNFSDSISSRLNNPVQAAKSMWAYIDARDAAAAIIYGLRYNENGFDVFNIAAPYVFSELNTNRLIKKYPTYPEIKKKLNGRQAIFSSLKAEEKLGFRARYLWSTEGIHETSYSNPS